MKTLVCAAALAAMILTVWPAKLWADSAPSGAGPSGTMLQNKAVWDIHLFQAHCNQAYQVTVADKVAPYPGQELITKDFNPEFVHRLDAMISFYQGTQNNDIGIVPGEGAFRTPQQQHDLYKIGRTRKPGTDGTHESDWLTPAGADIRTSVWIGWHNLGLASDFCQYEGGKPKIARQLDGTMGVTLPLKSKAWIETYVEVATDLGFIWGGWFHDPYDPGHLEWHPALHNPSALEAGGVPDLQFGAIYNSKIPQDLYMWSGDKPTSDAQDQVLYVLTVVYDSNWVAVTRERRIERGIGGLKGCLWKTYDKPMRLFPAYVPTWNLIISPFNDFERKTYAYSATVHTLSFSIDAAKFKHYGSADATASFCPNLQIEDWETVVETDIRSSTPKKISVPQSLKASDPQKYNQQVAAAQKRYDAMRTMNQGLIAKYAAIRNLPIYDVDAAVTTLDPPDGKPYDTVARAISVDPEGYTFGNPDAVHLNDSPRGPSFEFTWGRTDGAIGVWKMQDDQKGPYDLLKIRSTRIYPTNSFVMISPTLPSGAFDMPMPPPWPTPNPRPQ